jgi:hypothetical protein
MKSVRTEVFTCAQHEFGLDRVSRVCAACVQVFFQRTVGTKN